MGPGFGSAAASQSTSDVPVLGGGDPKIAGVGENNVATVDVRLAQ